MHEQLFIALQRLTPQHLLSRAIGYLAKSETPFIRQQFISGFISKYQVDMSEAAESDPEAYTNFNAFFTRALKPDARPLCPEGNIACPADGAVSQIGEIKDGQIFQAKGRNYSLSALVGGNDDYAAPFLNGKFATIYLSPRDYHRVHMPLAGKLEYMVHVPGDLFSVNQSTAEGVENLFARNERVVCGFVTDHGPMIIVLVGAMIVASIETVWAGQITPRTREITYWRYPTAQPNLQRGEEMGRFLLGSTAIVLLPQNAKWSDTLEAGTPVKMGQAFGSIQ